MKTTMFGVLFSGPFGYIKPYSAVRDSETFSQQFLTPSILEGLEKKLFPEFLETKGLQGAIVRHRISYLGIDKQQEVTQPKGFTYSIKPIGKAKDDFEVKYGRKRSIILRGLLLEPEIWLFFSKLDYAESAIQQHICLCRNEDVMLPKGSIKQVCEEELLDHEGMFQGIELRIGEGYDDFPVGYNRYNNGHIMRGTIEIIGSPIRTIDSSLYDI